MGVVPLNRTLAQEILAIERRASLECLVCGEFLLHDRGGIACSECGARLLSPEKAGLQLRLQAG